MRYPLFLLSAFVAGCFAGCSHSPTAPTEIALTVYEDRFYEGGWHDVTADWPNLFSVEGPCGKIDTGHGSSGGHWNDCVTSIRLRPGWVATGYRDRSFSGPTLEITQDIPNLRNIPGPCDHGWDDCLSSIRVSKQ
jgi:hypothetical protein